LSWARVRPAGGAAARGPGAVVLGAVRSRLRCLQAHMLQSSLPDRPPEGVGAPCAERPARAHGPMLPGGERGARRAQGSSRRTARSGARAAARSCPRCTAGTSSPWWACLATARCTARARCRRPTWCGARARPASKPESPALAMPRDACRPGCRGWTRGWGYGLELGAMGWGYGLRAGAMGGQACAARQHSVPERGGRARAGGPRGGDGELLQPADAGHHRPRRVQLRLRLAHD